MVKHAVLDSNVVISLSKRQITLNRLTSKYNKFSISIITYLEVLGFNFETPEEELLTTAFVNSFEIVGINSVVVDYVIQIRKTSKIKLPDAIILATSKSLTADLITSNLKDFIGVERGVHVLSPTEV